MEEGLVVSWYLLVVPSTGSNVLDTRYCICTWPCHGQVPGTVL